MVKLAVIDFCETVANFQTLDPYLEYVLKNERKKTYTLLTNKILNWILKISNQVIWKLGYHRHLKKALMVLALKGVSEAALYEYGKKYYEERIEKNLIPETLALIAQLQSEGYMTLIVSGGSKYYINNFAETYAIDGIICAEIKIKKGICSGKIINECLGKQKVKMLNRFILNNKLDVSEKVCITDSKSDMPILNDCNRKIIISHNCHKEWVEGDMEEIIWK